MNNDFLGIINSINDKGAASFLAKTDAEASSITSITQVVKDLSWIEMLESMIPYIDVIVRNPRKFIVSEEELIPVEKTKKVTEESIKHLAKHTSLIQDIDEDGSVKPLKLLNVFKEETTDLYENRFIYSLIVNTKTFLNNQLENDSNKMKSRYINKVHYESVSKLQGEKVKFKVEVESEFSESADEIKLNNNIDERINRISEIFSDFLSTQFIKGLSGATPVRSPIRKTNVILKDKNFQKAVELWEFIEKYNIEESTKVVKTEKEEEYLDLADKMKVGTFIQYCAVNKMSKKEDSLNQKFSHASIRKLIEHYVSEYQGSEKEFKNLLAKEFKMAKAKKEKEYDDIRKVYRSLVTGHNNRIKNSLSFIK